MQSHWPIILVEGVMVFGGALAFGWWQLWSIRKDREKAALRRAEELAETATEASTAASVTSPVEEAIRSPKAAVIEPRETDRDVAPG